MFISVIIRLLCVARPELVPVGGCEGARTRLSTSDTDFFVGTFYIYSDGRKQEYEPTSKTFVQNMVILELIEVLASPFSAFIFCFKSFVCAEFAIVLRKLVCREEYFHLCFDYGIAG